MEHFKKDEWIRYAMDLVDEKTRLVMEEHLLHCDICLELYSDVVSESLETNIEYPQPDFSKKVMKKIITDASMRNKKKFIYYVAVASITLMLTFSGTFNFIGSKFSMVSSNVISKQKNYNSFIKYGWTEKLFHKTFNVLDGITTDMKK